MIVANAASALAAQSKSLIFIQTILVRPIFKLMKVTVVLPLMQNKNNLQMKTDYQVIVGYQRSF